MTDRDTLPLPDYDHLPLEGLRQRIRTLSADALTILLAYEQEHGNRLPVTEAMRQRLQQLQDGAEPSGGDPAGIAPERGDAPDVPHQTDDSSGAPPVNPPSQGDPTNPAQPRT